MTIPAILLVEDNDDDAELTVMVFEASRISNPVVRVSDGIDALDYLFARGKYADRDRSDVPAVILLDLNLPRLDGLDVLKAIRADTQIGFVPVVILSSSDEDADRLAAYRLGANSYVRKPVDYDQFAAAARDLGLYWLVLNQAPPWRSM